LAYAIRNGAVATVVDNPLHMVSQFPRRLAEEMVLTGFRYLAAKEFDGNRWMDKTPGDQMIRSAPFLRRIWPDSFFIFAQRRGIENVLSRQLKFPHHGFETNCRLWVNAMQAWRDVSGALNGCSLTVDQIDLEERLEQVAQDLAAGLMFDAEQTAQIAMMFRTLRPEDSGGKARSRVSLSTCGWTFEEQNTFTRICGEISEVFGYTTDQTYRLGSGNAAAA
jgi:hypothetical protein